MLLCGIIDELCAKSNSTRGVAYFFCQATDNRLNHSQAVLRGLTHSLLLHNSHLISEVREQFGEMDDSFNTLHAMLCSLLNNARLAEVYLVVDALDECLDDLRRLLEKIVDLSSYERAKILVSSSNWPTIEDGLSYQPETISLRLELNEGDISTAVGSYINFQVDSLAKTKKYKPETKEFVFNYLSTHSNNTFLWVALVCDKLRDPSVRNWHTSKKLEEFPAGLEGLYSRMIEQVLSSEDSELCRQILVLLLLAYRPLAISELTTYLERPEDFPTDYESLEEIVALCGSFLTLKDNTISFIHQSAKDFLRNKASQKLISTGFGEAHLLIASRSLVAMSSTLKRNIYNLSSPGTLISEVAPYSDADPLQKIKYACVYWIDHITESVILRSDLECFVLLPISECIVVYQFLSSHFLHWLEALSLLRSTPVAVLGLNKLRAVSNESSSTSRTKLEEFLNDAWRFVSYHKDSLEASPLQVYYSSLIFSPVHSVVRQLFKREEPSWLIEKPAVRDDWDRCLQTLDNTGGMVVTASFSPDGKLIVSSSYGGTIKLWNAETGVCLKTLQESYGQNRKVPLWQYRHKALVAFSPTGRIIAFSDRLILKIWNVAIAACEKRMDFTKDFEPDLGIEGLVFSPSGQQLATIHNSNVVSLWNVSNRTFEFILEGHTKFINSILYSSKGHLIASASHDGTIKLWDTKSGECIATLDEGEGQMIRSISFSENGNKLVSGGSDRVIRIWDIANSSCQIIPTPHMPEIDFVSFLPGGREIISTSTDRETTIRIWDYASHSFIRTVKASATTTSILLPNGKQLAIGGDAHIKILDLKSGRKTVLNGHSDSIQTLDFSPLTGKLISGSIDGTMRIWDTRAEYMHESSDSFASELNNEEDVSEDWCKIDCSTVAVQTLILSPTGRQVISMDETGCFKLWDISNIECPATATHSLENIRAAEFSPDESLLATLSNQGGLVIWDTSQGFKELIVGELLSPSDLIDEHTVSLLFSRDLTYFVASHTNWIARSEVLYSKIWNLSSGLLEETLELATSVKFSLDGEYMVLATLDREIKVHRRGCYSGRILGTHSGDISWTCSVSSDKVASASSDRIVKIWNIETSVCEREFSCAERLMSISLAVLSPDERMLISICDGPEEFGKIVVWDATDGSCIQTLDTSQPVRQISLSNSGNEIITERGIFRFDSTGDEFRLSQSNTSLSLCADNTWIMRGSERILWLPVEFRPQPSFYFKDSPAVVSGFTVIISCGSGQMLFLRFQVGNITE